MQQPDPNRRRAHGQIPMLRKDSKRFTNRFGNLHQEKSRVHRFSTSSRLYRWIRLGVSSLSWVCLLVTQATQLSRLVLSRIQQALRDVQEPAKAMCTGRRNVQELFACLQYSKYDFNQSSIAHSENSYCHLKNQCNTEDIIDSDCQKAWLEQLTPILCTCSQSINQRRLGKYQDDYQICVRSKGYTVDGGDPGPALIIAQVRFCEACF